MPGKEGLCPGHDPKGRAWNPDPSGKWLRSMVGKVDAERYFLVQESIAKSVNQSSVETVEP